MSAESSEPADDGTAKSVCKREESDSAPAASSRTPRTADVYESLQATWLDEFALNPADPSFKVGKMIRQTVYKYCKHDQALLVSKAMQADKEADREFKQSIAHLRERIEAWISKSMESDKPVNTELRSRLSEVEERSGAISQDLNLEISPKDFIFRTVSHLERIEKQAEIADLVKFLNAWRQATFAKSQQILDALGAALRKLMEQENVGHADDWNLTSAHLSELDGKDESKQNRAQAMQIIRLREVHLKRIEAARAIESSVQGSLQHPSLICERNCFQRLLIYLAAFNRRERAVQYSRAGLSAEASKANTLDVPKYIRPWQLTRQMWMALQASKDIGSLLTIVKQNGLLQHMGYSYLSKGYVLTRNMGKFACQPNRTKIGREPKHDIPGSGYTTYIAELRKWLGRAEPTTYGQAFPNLIVRRKNPDTSEPRNLLAADELLQTLGAQYSELIMNASDELKFSDERKEVVYATLLIPMCASWYRNHGGRGHWFHDAPPHQVIFLTLSYLSGVDDYFKQLYGLLRRAKESEVQPTHE